MKRMQTFDLHHIAHTCADEAPSDDYIFFKPLNGTAHELA